MKFSNKFYIDTIKPAKTGKGPYGEDIICFVCRKTLLKEIEDYRVSRKDYDNVAVCSGYCAELYIVRRIK